MSLPRTLKRLGAAGMPSILCVAGFGDDGSMFAPLAGTELARRRRLVTFDLPGFGEEPLPAGEEATLIDLADRVARVAAAEGAGVVMAHSVASIIASLAAQNGASAIHTLISLEGNLTEADAYFSGMAADFETPEAFREAFLTRLETLARDDPVLARYRSRVARAQPRALWTLGRDAAAFSAHFVPGEILLEPAQAHYLYNPVNCPDESVEWLRGSGLPAVELPGASHWATVDAPDLVSDAVLKILA